MPIFNEFFNENLDALLLQRGFCYSGRSPAEMPDFGTSVRATGRGGGSRAGV